MITVMVTGGIASAVGLWLHGAARSARNEPVGLPRLELATVPARPTAAARAAAERVGWQQLLLSGGLQPVCDPVPDPGNPGHWLVLAEDPTGSLGDVRVLIGADGTPEKDGPRTYHGVVVPGSFTDPIAAAAWTYDDPTHPLRTQAGDYADLAVRR